MAVTGSGVAIEPSPWRQTGRHTVNGGTWMNAAAVITREKEMRLLELAISRAENEGLQVLLRDPESRVISCAICRAESDHPSMIRHAAQCSYSTKPPTLRP
jgi:hypothetical protein